MAVVNERKADGDRIPCLVLQEVRHADSHRQDRSGTGSTLLAVWKSILDPWNLVLEGENPVFFASSIILAGVLAGWSHLEKDVLSLDARRLRTGFWSDPTARGGTSPLDFRRQRVRVPPDLSEGPPDL